MSSLMRRLFGGSDKPGRGCAHDNVTMHTTSRKYNASLAGSYETFATGVCHDCGYPDFIVSLGGVLEKADTVTKVLRMVMEGRGYRHVDNPNEIGSRWSRQAGG